MIAIDYDYVDPNTTLPSTYYEGIANTSGKNVFYESLNSLNKWVPLLKGDIKDEYLLLEVSVEADFHLGSVLTTPELINKIKEVFGLNPTQLSKIAHVSRATIYNHMKPETEFSNVENYQSLYELAIQVETKYGKVSNGLKNVLVNGKSLIKHLQSKDLNNVELLEIVDQVVSKAPVKQEQKLSYLEQRKANISSTLIG